MSLRSWYVAAMLLLLPVARANADVPGVADPVAATRKIYDTMALGDIDHPGRLPFTARLSGLEALNGREFGADEVGRLDFDIYMNGQDGKISAVHASTRPVDNAADRQVVFVTFRNFDQRLETHFFWERGADGLWRVDDVRALGENMGNSDMGWTLSLLYKYGWDGSAADLRKLSEATAP